MTDYTKKYKLYKSLYRDTKKKCVVSALRSYLQDTKDDWNYILPTELNEKIENSDMDNMFLLDIRRPEDYSKGHIKGATNIYWLNLLDEDSLKRLPRDKKIVLICYVGHTASQMLVLLRLAGFDVVALKFGMGVSPSDKVEIAGWLQHRFNVDM